MASQAHQLAPDSYAPAPTNQIPLLAATIGEAAPYLVRRDAFALMLTLGRAVGDGMNTVAVADIAQVSKKMGVPDNIANRRFPLSSESLSRGGKLRTEEFQTSNLFTVSGKPLALQVRLTNLGRELIPGYEAYGANWANWETHFQRFKADVKRKYLLLIAYLVLCDGVADPRDFTKTTLVGRNILRDFPNSEWVGEKRVENIPEYRNLAPAELSEQQKKTA